MLSPTPQQFRTNEANRLIALFPNCDWGQLHLDLRRIIKNSNHSETVENFKSSFNIDCRNPSVHSASLKQKRFAKQNWNVLVDGWIDRPLIHYEHIFFEIIVRGKWVEFSCPAHLHFDFWSWKFPDKHDTVATFSINSFLDRKKKFF